MCRRDTPVYCPAFDHQTLISDVKIALKVKNQGLMSPNFEHF